MWRHSLDVRTTDGVEISSRSMRGRTHSSSRNLLIVLLAGALALIGVGAQTLPVVAPPQKDFAADLEAFVAALAARDQFSGSVLLARHGQPLVRRGYGWADRARRRPNTLRNRHGGEDLAHGREHEGRVRQLSFDTTLGALVPDYPLADACDGVDRRDVKRDGRRRSGRVAGGHAGAAGPDFGVDRILGLPNVKEPHGRHVRGQLWEIRLKGKAAPPVRFTSQRERSVS